MDVVLMGMTSGVGSVFNEGRVEDPRGKEHLLRRSERREYRGDPEPFHDTPYYPGTTVPSGRIKLYLILFGSEVGLTKTTVTKQPCQFYRTPRS